MIPVKAGLERGGTLEQHRKEIPQERYEIMGDGSTGHKSYTASEENRN